MNKGEGIQETKGSGQACLAKDGTMPGYSCLQRPVICWSGVERGRQTSTKGVITKFVGDSSSYKERKSLHTSLRPKNGKFRKGARLTGGVLKREAGNYVTRLSKIQGEHSSEGEKEKENKIGRVSLKGGTFTNHNGAGTRGLGGVPRRKTLKNEKAGKVVVTREYSNKTKKQGMK